MQLINKNRLFYTSFFAIFSILLKIAKKIRKWNIEYVFKFINKNRQFKHPLCYFQHLVKIAKCKEL